MWSGGKDCALALDRARRAGLDVAALINFHDRKTRQVRFHATSVAMLEAQASALDLVLVKVPSSWSEMERKLEEELRKLHDDGFTGVIFGNIHLADVRAWYEARVIAAGLEHLEPLWGDPPATLLNEFVSSGGRAVLTCVDRTRLDASWLGRTLDANFVLEMSATGCDPCGENGEYHTYVFDGPLFNRPVRWIPGISREEGPFLQLEVRAAPPISAPVL